MPFSEMDYRFNYFPLFADAANDTRISRFVEAFYVELSLFTLGKQR